jgi:hypothetical protein
MHKVYDKIFFFLGHGQGLNHSIAAMSRRERTCRRWAGEKHLEVWGGLRMRGRGLGS